MSPRPTQTLRTRCSWLLAALALTVGCGDAVPTVRPPGGSGGTGGSASAGGSGGSTGTGGMSGTGGTGGTAGSGGTAGGGGTAGTGGSASECGGGTAGTGGAVGVCVTNAMCHTCPSEALPEALLCDTDSDCLFPGYLCIASGCTTHAGASIGQCQALASGSCVDDTDCPNTDDYDCQQVGNGGSRCLRVTAGCSPSTESYDCAPGFSCESGTCVDRRVGCDSSEDCPKSHICHTGIPTGNFCVRVYRTCHADEDCRWAGVSLGAGCADVDGDGRDECTGDLDEPDNPCVNSMCPESAPVCENGVFGTGTDAVCGDYGLCRTDDDCRDPLVCVALGQDGRKECVEAPASAGPCDCESATDCSPRQVCAAPRDGGSPSCQIGKEAM